MNGIKTWLSMRLSGKLKRLAKANHEAVPYVCGLFFRRRPAVFSDGID